MSSAVQAAITATTRHTKRGKRPDSSQKGEEAIGERGMDRVLEKTRYRLRSLTRATTAAYPQQAGKMASAETTRDGMVTETDTIQKPQSLRQIEGGEYAHIAVAVALTLKPMIKETVETTMKTGGRSNQSRHASANKRTR